MKEITLIIAATAVITAFGACASKKKQVIQPPIQPMQQVVYQK